MHHRFVAALALATALLAPPLGRRGCSNAGALRGGRRGVLEDLEARRVREARMVEADLQTASSAEEREREPTASFAASSA